ncbi:MAG TPA: 2-phospho-L-lactate guanylyltransferase [Actinoplanes sp.]|nr:2-phospho-L-lactate guanylyltransferase [Actinoplanes sp.]
MGRVARWTAVIPVKRLGAAKSRLRGAVPAARHQDLALAMLGDTATAVLATRDVADLLVVTDDPAAAAVAHELGARSVPEPRAGSGGPAASGTDAGLNDALRYGADTVAGLRRDRVVLAADLPALTPDDLGAALRSAGVRSFVADAAGTGTTLLTARRGTALDPHFGAGSASAHARSGAAELTGDWPGLRQDVDTAADLRTVLALGPGPRTCALLRDLGLVPDCGSSRLPAA